MQSLLTSWRAKAHRPTALLATGLRWWADELIGVFGPWLQRLGLRQPVQRLRWEADGELRLASPTGEPDTAAPDWAAACAGRRTEVLLDAAHVLQLSLSLPRAASGRLREAVGYRLITESPIVPEQLYFDARLAGRPSSGPRSRDLAVDVVLCRRDRMGRLCQRLDAAGVTDRIIGFSTGPGMTVDFVFASGGAAQRHSPQARLHRLLFCTGLIIGLMTWPVTYFGARWLTEQTEQDIRALRTAQAGVMQLYEQQALIDSARDELNRHTGGVPLGATLNEVAARLPTSAWLQAVRFEGGHLKLSGTGTEPAALVPALKAAPLLANAKLDAVTGAAGGSDASTVQFELAIPLRNARPQ